MTWSKTIQSGLLQDFHVCDLRVVLEGMQDPSALSVAGPSVDEGLLQHHSVVAQRKDVV